MTQSNFMDSLKEYNEKRDFSKTKEPGGNMVKLKGSRFVVQHHMARAEHYDFRLEAGGVLISWAIPKGPSFNPKDKRLAVHVEDHPFNYKDFEGIIPKGQYGGGTVMIWDEGTYTAKENVNNSVEEGSIKFTLSGKRLKGNWSLIKLRDTAKQDNWLLIKENDEFAQDEAGISGFLTSIRTGRNMAEIEKNLSAASIKNPFDTAGVQLASLANDIPEGDWIYELKYDGYRILSYIENDKISLITRNGLDYTNHFPYIAKTVLKWANKRAMVLDGEMIVTDESGRSDFSAMQNHIKKGGRQPLSYVAFDLLAFEGKDLRKLPLLTRKEKLQKLLAGAPEELQYSSHTDSFNKDMLDKICAGGFEGLIAKKTDSVYSGKRNGDWLKIKCASRQEFAVGGYSVTDKAGDGISSLLLGYNEGGDFIYAGRSGTGFNEEESKRLKNMFKSQTVSSSPFTVVPKAAKNESIYWVNPQFVAEIQFTEWTKEGLLRHPSYLGLRSDKPADEVVKEKTDIKAEKTTNKNVKETADGIDKFKLTNPQKLLFNNPETTKQQVAEYYYAAAKRMLPYISGRILSTICCPGGAPSTCFFKKHVLEQLEGVKSVQMQDKSDFFYVSSVKGLMSLVQYNTIEFHTWGCIVDEIEKPDMMVFDFDPDEGLNLDSIRQGVLDLKGILDEFKLKAFLKTSGGKGYHVVIPFKKTKSWDEFKDFAKSVAVIMESAYPDRYTSNVRKERRKGKIFVDWMRNTKGATCVAPYSLRARDGAKVSMPIPWNMLNKIAPDEIDIPAALKLLNDSDPWQ